MSRMRLIKDFFCQNSPVYPSRQREIIEWFNNLPENNKYMVKDLIEDALLWKEFDDKNSVVVTEPLPPIYTPKESNDA